MRDLVELLRPYQWYKNLLVFLPLIFSQNITNAVALASSVLAFASLCAISSASYVLNDIVDRKSDRLNPEKRSRPLASGRIGVPLAVFIGGLLTIVGFGIALVLPIGFVYAALGLFVLSQLYSLWLKHETFADILTIATNFVIRAVAGALAIQVWVSPWLVAGVFFLALFLILGKRRSEMVLLKRRAKSHRKVLGEYTPEIIMRLSTLSTTSLVLSYALFVFFGSHQWLFVTLPFALYGIFRYESLIEEGSSIARHPHMVLTDGRMVVAIVLWAVTTVGALYV